MADFIFAGNKLRLLVGGGGCTRDPGGEEYSRLDIILIFKHIVFDVCWITTLLAAGVG